MTKRYFKGFAFIVCFILMSMMPSRSMAQGWYGDVNADGRVSIDDVMSLIDGLLQGNHSSPFVPDRGYLSAKDFGAVGDGRTDDTEALERLFETAFNAKKAVFFDQGTYMIRRSLMLRSGMEIYGENATIKKRTAITTALSEPVVKGQTYLNLKSASGFSVGDQIVIVSNSGANFCTYGIITGIEGNRIQFTNILSDVQPNFPGCIIDYAAGASVSNSFALLRSWSTRFDCDGVYIHDLTLDGNRIYTEPRVWACSCIHLDGYYGDGYTGNTGIEYRHVQRNLIARNLTIKNSPCDAISDQGAGGLFVTDCEMVNNAMHGVHLGTVFANAMISNNVMTGNGINGSGIFLCESVTNVIVENNIITKFNHGCSDEEFGNCGKYIMIRNNTFNNITSFVFDFLKANAGARGGGLHVCNNTITELKSLLFTGQYLDDVIVTNNEVTSVTTTPSKFVSITNCKNAVVAGNKVPADVTVSTPVVSTNTTNIIDASNTWN